MTDSPEASTTAPLKHERKKTPPMIWLALGGSLAALGGLFSLLQTTQHMHQHLMQQEAALVHLTRSQATLDRELHMAEITLKTKVTAVEKQVQRVIQKRANQTSNWLLQRARYCLELAAITTQWSEDTTTAVVLLQQADAALAQIPDHRLQPIRQAITHEKIILKAIPTLDLTGLLNQLNAVITLINTLSIHAFESHPNNPMPASKATPNWRAHLKDSVGLLEKLVVIQHHPDHLRPIPSAAYASLLREEAILYLQTAQWAALQHNNTLFHTSLTHAIETLQTAFSPVTEAATALFDQLHTLQQLQLHQQKPLLNKALPLLNQFIEESSQGETTS